MLLKKTQDLLLLRLRLSRSRSTPTRVLCSKEHRRRAALVRGSWVGAASDKPNSSGAAIAHSAMQRSDTAIVDRIRVCACLDKGCCRTRNRGCSYSAIRRTNSEDLPALDTSVLNDFKSIVSWPFCPLSRPQYIRREQLLELRQAV
jgi:hypothetical protein